VPRGVDRLSVFAFLWGTATLSHHLASPRWFVHHAWLNVALVAVAVLVVLRPHVNVLFTALAALGFVNVVKLAPEHPNHMLFEGVGDLVIVSAVLLAVHEARRRGGVERQQLFERMAAPIRVGALILYAWALLHKLNWDFLDADVSCGGVLLRDTFARSSLPPPPAWAGGAAMWGSLLVEGAILLGLVFGPSRAWAVGLALFFHLFLAQHPVTGLYSFSATMLPVLFLFTPPAFTDAIGEQVERARRVVRRRPAATGALAATALALALLAVGSGEESRRQLWNVWAVFAVGIYGVWAWRHRGEFEIAGAFRIRPAVLWVFPLLLLVNGASPYLGLKTHASFSMFSNLRTEDGRTNHMLLGRLSLGTWQDDLVDIVDTDLPSLAKMKDADLRLTYFHFRRLAGTARRDFGVTYRRKGELRVLRVRDGIANDPEAATPPPWWMHKLLRFRGVDRDGRTRCWN
jgi:hypothetical protein